MLSLELILLTGSFLILLSIGIARLTDNLGVPTLLLFLGIGILAGAEGPGGIHFNDISFARSLGIVSLILILFAGGLDTRWSSVRTVVFQAISLSTLGVLITAGAVGIFVSYFFNFSILEGLLLGAVVSSTDAAAVFSVLRSRNVSLSGQLKPLLELESGSNDPMAVFLTIGIIQILINPFTTWTDIIVLFIVQMGIGALGGLVFGKLIVFLLNHLKIYYEGVYPVFTLAFAILVYSIISIIGGSGFLAVYLAGILLGNSEVVHKKNMFRFFDGMAWLSQIGMFLTLGLLIYPSHILPVLGIGLTTSLFLMFVARPISVFVSLISKKFHWREKAMVSWVGLRGAVPIILATFPLLANLPNSEMMFNIVFFIVLTSALFQGWSIPIVARLLKVDAPWQHKRKYPIEFEPPRGVDTELIDFIVPYNADMIGKSIVELGLPDDSLIVLISRNDEYIVPSGGTSLEAGDTLLILVNKQNMPRVREIFSEQK